MPPLWDQTGVPGDEGLAHFHSSTTSGSASWMSLRIRFSAEPRQSPSSRIRWSIICEEESGVRELSVRGTGRPLQGHGMLHGYIDILERRRRSLLASIRSL